MRSDRKGAAIAATMETIGPREAETMARRSVAMHGKGWSIADWKNDWRRWAEASGGYMDGASRRSLENLQAGVDTPSDSNDLAGASRIAIDSSNDISTGGVIDKVTARRRSTRRISFGPAVRCMRTS